MHTWVRRGLRTALVTGGLLMLGTGIASADENVNPDQPPSSVDAGVSVPVHAGAPLGAATQPGVAKAVGQKVTTPAQSAAAAPVRSAAGRANPLVRQAQPFAQRVTAPQATTPKVTGRPVADPSATLSGTLTPVQMATPNRTANDAVTGSNSALSGVLAKGSPLGDIPVVHNGPLVPSGSAVPNTAVPNSAVPNSTAGNSLMAERLPSAPRNGVLTGAPVVPSVKGVGLFGDPQARPAPATPGALPSAPTGTPVGTAVHGVSPRLPVRYQTEAPTSARPTVQSNQVLSHSPLDSLPGGLSGGLLSGAVPQAQSEVPTSTVQSQPLALPSNGPLPSVPTVGQVAERVTSLPTTGTAGLPTAQTQSSPIGVLPDTPTEPDIVPLLKDVSNAFSHAQIKPADAPASTTSALQALDSSPLGAPPSLPTAPSVPDVSSAPAAQKVADTVPATQSAVTPFAAPSTSALPAPIGGLPVGGLLGGLGSPGGLPVVGSLVSKLPVGSQLPGAPTPARQSADGSALSTAPQASGLLDTVSGKASSALPATQAAEVPSSVPSLPSLGQATGVLPSAPSLPQPGDVVTQAAEVPSSAPNLPSVDQATGALPSAPSLPLARGLATQAAEVPASASNAPSVGQATDALPGASSGLSQAAGLLDKAGDAVPMLQGALIPAELVAGATQDMQPVGDSGVGSPISPQAAMASTQPLTTGVPNSAERSVNNSPYGALPFAPRVPSAPSSAGLANDAFDVASSPNHATRMAGVPTSDVDTSNLPSAPVESVSYSPTGQMFGVPAVRAAGTGSLGAVPVEQMAQVPGTISNSVDDSPFAALPGNPRVPTVPSAPEVAARTSSQPPVSYVTGEPASAAHNTKVLGKPSAALPGVSDASGIAGVLPLARNLFPRI